MSVIITPSEQLEFHRPFTRISKESLIVKNPGTEPIVFKVKTTAPKQYCVRPNAGRIEANSDIEVQIILQPFKEELPEDFKCKDKFLVQTAPIKPALESLDISSMWSQIETTDKSSMHQHKIKCVFLPPSQEEQQVEENKVASIPETAATAEPIASFSKEQEEQVVPPPAIVAENTITSPPPPITTTALPVLPSPSITEEEKPVATTTTDTTTSTTTPPVITSPPPITTTTTPATTTTTTTTTPVNPVTKPAAQPPVVSSREIKKDDSNKDTELKAALEKIALLEKQLSDIRKEEGLRARNQTGTSNRKLASTVQPLDAVHQHLAALEKPRPTEGYPPQVVFGVAFLVFIITYLFF